MRHVEGPARYTASDVASAFAAAIGRPVAGVATPRDAWEETLQGLGFSPPAAASYARMLAITLDGAYEEPARPQCGATTLSAYVTALVGASAR